MGNNLVSVPIGWAIYEVDGDVKFVDAKGRESVPPHVGMETLVLSGKAKRIAVIQSVGDTIEAEVDSEEDDHGASESEGIWFGSDE